MIKVLESFNNEFQCIRGILNEKIAQVTEKVENVVVVTLPGGYFVTLDKETKEGFITVKLSLKQGNDVVTSLEQDLEKSKNDFIQLLFADDFAFGFRKQVHRVLSAQGGE